MARRGLSWANDSRPRDLEDPSFAVSRQGDGGDQGVELPGYRTGGVHTQTSGLRNILAYYGTRAPHSAKAYTEAMVFGVAGGVGVSYWTRERNDGAPLITASFRNVLERDEGFFRRACGRLRVPVRVHETSSAAKAERALNEALTRQRAGLVWLDRRVLPYRWQAAELVAWPHHEAVVCGYDAASDVYFVDDRAPIPWRVEAVSLRDARGAIRSNKHRFMVVEPPAEYPYLGPAIEAGIRDCAEALSRPPVQNLGLPALEKWAKLVRQPGNAKGWPAMFPPEVALFDALASTYVAVVCDGTGGDALRGLYAEFLEEAQGVGGATGYWEAAQMFRLSGSLWRQFADSLLPQGVTPLGKARALLNTNRRLFETEGEPVWPGMAANNQTFLELRSGMEHDFPLSDGQIRELLHDLGEQLLAIHEVEAAAVAYLEGTLTAR